MKLDKIRELLKKEKERLGISYNDLAHKIKIAPQSVHNYLNSDTQPTMRSLQRIADYFNLTIPDLIDESVTTIHSTPQAYDDSYTMKQIIDIHKQIHDIEAEIGRIKDRLLDAAVSGDIKRLTLITGGKR